MQELRDMGFYPAVMVNNQPFGIFPVVNKPSASTQYTAVISDPKFRPKLMVDVKTINPNHNINHQPIYFVDDEVYRVASHLSVGHLPHDIAHQFGGMQAYRRLIAELSPHWRVISLHRSKMTVAALEEVLCKVNAIGGIFETRGSKFMIHYPYPHNKMLHGVEYSFDRYDRALSNLTRFESDRSE